MRKKTGCVHQLGCWNRKDSLPERRILGWVVLQRLRPGVVWVGDETTSHEHLVVSNFSDLRRHYWQRQEPSGERKAEVPCRAERNSSTVNGGWASHRSCVGILVVNCMATQSGHLATRPRGLCFCCRRLRWQSAGFEELRI